MARIASVGPAVPPEARNQGSTNETTPAEQRKPEGAPLSEGPKKNEAGAFLPASYKTKTEGHTIIRTDR